jgi:tRNA pseudouridine55 synthase
MDGLLVVDKPQGVTSHDVVAVARRRLREKRIGHTGTLDPLATGVLPLACGRATRLVRFLTAADKDYEAIVRFGLTTDSYDITGEETSRSAVRPSRQQLDEALASLRGDYLQMPPAYSAKKVAGRRAYDLARNDEPVTLTAVPVSVTRAAVTAFDGDSARIELTCSAGFYVRALAHSLGQLVGAGACLEALRRTRSGDFDLESAITLDALAEDQDGAAGFLIPMEELLPRMPAVRVTDEGLQRVSHGRELEARHLLGTLEPRRDLAAQPYTRLFDADGHLLALATSGGTPGSLHPSVVLI